MKTFLVVCTVVAAAAAVKPLFNNYHWVIGMPLAQDIRASEKNNNGQPAVPGQFPYMAGLLIWLPGKRVSVCGSSLVSHTKLVTAAHCWIHDNTTALHLVVVLGSTRLYTGGVRIRTSDVVTHPGYSRDTISNDVAVITIRWVRFTNVIYSIRLAEGAKNYNYQWATAVGFGLSAPVKIMYKPPVLNFVKVRVIRNAECSNVYGPIILDSTLCTNGDRHSICTSDSGGPLVIGDELVGIVSFSSASVGCGTGFPNGYARVTSFAPWIKDHMRYV